MGISLPHLLILVFILLIFFGPSRLPALGQSIGKAIKGFKDGLNDLDAAPTDSKQAQLKPSDDVIKQATEVKKDQNS